MSPRRSYSVQPVDMLVFEALWAEVGKEKPSPRIWRRICRQVQGQSGRRRRRPARSWSIGLVDLPEPQLRAYDLAYLRILAWVGVLRCLAW